MEEILIFSFNASNPTIEQYIEWLREYEQYIECLREYEVRCRNKAKDCTSGDTFLWDIAADTVYYIRMQTKKLLEAEKNQENNNVGEGVWVTYHFDYSGGVSVWPTEVEALRDAHSNSKDVCRFLEWGKNTHKEKV